jgi:predicted HTH domain antitoxin
VREEHARLLLAAKLYELGRLSAGLAAKLACLDRLAFLASLAHYGVPAINLGCEEVSREIEVARQLGKE